MEGWQYAANFGGSNIRDRPATVACSRRLQGELKTIAAILDRPVIEKILAYLGLAGQPPPKGRAREVGLHFAA